MEEVRRWRVREDWEGYASLHAGHACLAAGAPLLVVGRDRIRVLPVVAVFLALHLGHRGSVSGGILNRLVFALSTRMVMRHLALLEGLQHGLRGLAVHSAIHDLDDPGLDLGVQLAERESNHAPSLRRNLGPWASH